MNAPFVDTNLGKSGKYGYSSGVSGNPFRIFLWLLQTRHQQWLLQAPSPETRLAAMLLLSRQLA